MTGTTVNTVAITTNKDTTGEIPVSGRGGLAIIPSGSSITTLTAYTADRSGGDRVPLNDVDGDAVVMTVAAGNAYDMPASVYGCRMLYLKGDAAGSIFVTSRN